MNPQYEVKANSERVDAWSTTRLPFEPRGWLVDYRAELRAALRGMVATEESVLQAEYASPDRDFVDLENVLLYNVGSGSYAHLARTGLACTRVASPDGLHRVSYALGSECPPLGGELLAKWRSASEIRSDKPAVWWAVIRPEIVTMSNRSSVREYGINVELGKAWSGGDFAPILKPMLDGLVSALHVHDGSARDRVVRALAAFGDGASLWDLLCDPGSAVLGVRQLVRPHGERIAWNPADELCSAFRVVRGDRADAMTVQLVAR